MVTTNVCHNTHYFCVERDNTQKHIFANEDSKQNIAAVTIYNNSKNASSNYQAGVQF